MRESFGSNEIVLYLDCDGGYVNLHAIKWHTTISTIVLTLISWF